MSNKRMANKLMLLDDVDGFGRKGDVVTVRPGFARNFLLPQKFAIIASKQALRMQARLQEERRNQAVVDKKEADEAAERIQDQVVSTTVKIDHEGHMYGSVTALDVVHLVRVHLGVTIEKRHVLLPHAIKETGDHTIKLRLKESVPATFTLKVIPEEEKKKEE